MQSSPQARLIITVCGALHMKENESDLLGMGVCMPHT